MTLSVFVLAAAAAAQAATPQAKVDPAQARAQGMAQAQQALAAQAPAGSPSPQVISPAPLMATLVSPQGQSILRAGTEVPLKLEEGLSSNDKAIREGQQFHLSVAENVMVGNMVVIPAGSPALGEITDLRRKGMWGKSGHIVARALSVRVGDRLIRLTGNFDEHGTTGTAGVVAAIAFVPIAGFLMTGTSAKIPAGSGVKAFLDEDVAIAMPAAAVAATTLVPAATPAQPQAH